jgi:uncharacterized membrane protein YoaK (UPF0700 family)
MTQNNHSEGSAAFCNLDSYLLIFIAGSINATSFLSSAQFVSHVTGSITLLGIALAKHTWWIFITTLSIPCLFLIGVMIAGIIIQDSNTLSHRGRYERTLEIMSFCLAGIAAAGYCGLFSGLGKVLSINDTYIYSGMLAVLTGFQNGAITALSKGTQRITHLTGLVTDLGLNTANILYHKKCNSDCHSEYNQLKIKLIKVFAFVFGSSTSSYLFLKYGYISVLVPSLVAFLTIVYSQYRKYMSEYEEKYPVLSYPKLNLRSEPKFWEQSDTRKNVII